MDPSERRRRRRSILACDKCRASKLKCINEDDVEKGCVRCEKLKLTCKYSPKLSQLKKKSMGRIKNFEKVSCSKFQGFDPNVPSFSNSVGGVLTELYDSSEIKAFAANVALGQRHLAQATYDKGGYFKVAMPPKNIILEIADIFFKNQYQGIFPFIHKPSFQAFVRSEEFDPETYIDDYYERFEERPSKYASSLYAPDPVVLLAMLALCARLHPSVVERYGHFNENNNPQFFLPSLRTSRTSSELKEPKMASNASKYFAWHARNRLKDVFDSPSIQRVQALTMLSSHEWGEINAGRSFSYIGLAARMALMMGMGSPDGICYKNNDEPMERFITKSFDSKDKENLASIILESKRRTLWSVYMMDRCISSGRNRSPAVKIEEINIPVPCSEQSFTFGEPSTGLTYSELVWKDETLNQDFNLQVNETKKRLSGCSSYAFTIMAFEVWAGVGKWVGEVGSREQQFRPWLSTSKSFMFSTQLDTIEESLPSHLKFSIPNLHAHMAENTAGLFGYLHCLLFISRIFINRENFYCRPNLLPKGWWQKSTERLFTTIKASTTLLDTLSQESLMVIAPFTGFELFTNAGTCLYFNIFPDKFLEQYSFAEDSDITATIDPGSFKKEFRKLAKDNIRLLKNWAHVWSLCRLWLNWVSQMQIMPRYLGELIANDPIKKQSLRLALRDYGQNEIVEDNDYVEADSDQLKKTRLLKDILDTEEALSIISLLNSKVNTNSPHGRESPTSEAYESADSSHLYPNYAKNVAELELLDNADLSYYLQGWYDVVNIGSTIGPHNENGE